MMEIQGTGELIVTGSQSNRTYTVIYREGEYVATVGEKRNGEKHYVSGSFKSLRGAELFIKSLLKQTIVR
jgi:hypothetical protein